MVKVDKFQLFKSSHLSSFKVPRALCALLIGLILISNPLKAEFGSIVDIGLAGDLYFTDESANNGQGFVNLLIQNSWSNSQVWLDVGAGGLVGKTASSYIKAPQMFYRYGNRDKHHFIIGRYRHQWSFADDFWNMGLTQPLFKWNEAVPEKQGLTGLFYTGPLIGKALEFTLFGSVVYIPTQGPSFDISDGQITSSNPWFNEPVEILNISGQKADVNFQIDLPNTQDVVAKNRESVGLQVQTPLNRQGFLFNGFYMDKPRNELVLPFDGFLNLTTFNADITIRPQVARHQVGGVDIGWHFRRFKTLFSWIHESAVNYTVPDNTTFPIIPAQNIFSFQQLVRLTRSQRIWFGYINVNRNENLVGGTFANAPISTYLYRNRFEEALRIRWEGLLLKTSQKYNIKASFSYTQNIQDDGLWLSANLKWSIYKGFEMFSHCDFFGGSRQEITSSDFINTYQNNDRCLIGGHYAF